MAALLSSVSPVFAAGVSTTGAVVRNSSGIDVPYPFGSHGSIVFAGDDDYCGVDNVVGRGGTQQQGIANKISAEQEFENFIYDQATDSGRNPYGTTTKKVTWVSDGVLSDPKASYMGTATRGSQNILPEAYGVYSFVTGCGASATGNYSTAFGAGATTKAGGAQAFGVAALASGRASVAMGVSSETSGEAAVAIGGLATAAGNRSIALGAEAKAEDNYAIAIGLSAEAKASGSIAIGSRRSDRTDPNDPNRKAIAVAKNAIAIGTDTFAKEEDSVAIGANAQVLVHDGVAVGGGAVSDRAKGVKGYDPYLDGDTTETNNMAWISTTGAFSVGEVGGTGNGNLTRQITGVAAGSADTDAVNVAQLKAMREVIAGGGGWKISANDTDPTNVNAGNTVDFSVTKSNVGQDNLKVVKNTADNKHKIQFALSDNLKLTSVTTGQSSMSNDGFIINSDNGPRMTIDGIDAGNQAIKNVADGEEDNDAVNLKQLKAMAKANKTIWQLAVEGGDATAIGPNGMVNLQAAGNENKKNIKIEKDSDHNVTFGLADNITVKSVTAGNTLISEAGFAFVNGNGPQITTAGIDAGSKKITKVVEGTDDTDAVNFKQLKDLTAGIKTGWKLAVEDEETTDVGAGSTVKFIAVEDDDLNKNIKIVRGTNNEVKFDLADNINVMTVTAGESIMNDDGFFINGDSGPSMTVDGINAGYTNITKVLEATEDDEAVNFGQLKRFVGKGSGWKLSVDGQNATDVTAGSTVDFVAIKHKNDDGSENDEVTNIKIIKDENNKVSFDLNDYIKVNRVETGITSLSNAGLMIKDGPRVTKGGIDAGGKTISRVANGVLDEDAVNLSQLKEITSGIKTGWKLSVDGDDATDIGAESTVKFVAAMDQDSHKNIKIVRGNDNEVKFDLNELIKVKNIKVGNEVTINDKGLAIRHGPSITYGGIDAGDREIRNVADGVLYTDAVNLSQLQKVEEKIKEVADNSLVKWIEDQKLITIGAQKDGTKISIANSNGQNRVISGVADGNLGKASTDAINGSQINKISGDIAQFLGGDAAFQDGAFVGPKYQLTTIDEDGTIAIKRYSDVGSALDAVNKNVFHVDHTMIIGFNDIADYFGGGAKYEKGKWQAPTFKVSRRDTNGGIVKNNYQNVADAFDAVDTSITDIYSQINNVTGNSLVKWIEDQKLITIGAQKDGTKISIANSNGQNRVISGVADGNLGKASTDAINGSQINKISGDIAQFFGGNAAFQDGAFVGPRYNLSTVSADGNVEQKIFDNVGDALTGLDANVKNVNKHVQYVDNKFNKFSQDALLWDDGKRAFSARHEKGEGKTDSKITSLLKGDVTEDSTDAINGSQLFNIAQNISEYFGGSTDVIEGIQPTFLIDGNSYNNVTEAFTGVNVSIHKIDNKISNLEKNNLVKQEGGVTSIITIGKDTAGTEINIAGVGKIARKISGVQEAEKGDEAVNKNQLDKSIEKISKDIETASAAAVLYDKDEGGIVNYGSVTLGGDKNNGPVALLNVKDGRISQDSHDAINGSQINKISRDIANYFGGDAKFVGGTFKGPKYSLSVIVEEGQVAKANYYNVGDALTGLDANVKSVNNRITNVANNFNQKIEDISKDALLWDDEEQAFVARHEKDGKKTNSKLKYLVDGDIFANSTDAINGSQLYAMGAKIAAYFGGGAKYENGQWTAPQFKIVQVNVDGTTVEKTHGNVADAFGDVNKNMSNINNRIDDVINKSDLDALKWNSDKKAYDATHDGTPSKIINVADGKIAKGSKEAVNGGQLWQTNERVAKVENRVTDVENHVEIIDKKVDNISNTIEDIGDIVINIDTKVDKIDDKVNNIAEDAVRYDRDASGKKTNKITLKGSDPSEPVMIDNVADGRIEKGSKEAVNGGQLHDYTKEQMKIVLDESKRYTDQRVNNIVIDAIDDAVDKSKHYTDMKFEALNYSIEGARKEARQAAAIGLAVANLRYNDTPGKLSVGFGSGLWRSQSAFAFGAGYTSEKGDIRSNVSVTTSGGHWGVGAGFNMTLN
ncbi:Vomp family autotransporter [Bartonella sp. ML70XJBT.G]|uniref:Vomp family autotransporter n=1 Tax=Bartonella sp. ML70XJBT.G TaxID=3019093 RepID=UPI0038576E8B